MSGYGEFNIPNPDLTWITDQENIMGSTDRPAEAPTPGDGDTINRMPKELLDNTLKNLENINELDVRLQSVENTIATSSEIQDLENIIASINPGSSTPVDTGVSLKLVSPISITSDLTTKTWTMQVGDFSDIPQNIKGLFGMVVLDGVAAGANFNISVNMNSKKMFHVESGGTVNAQSVSHSNMFLYTNDNNAFNTISVTFSGSNHNYLSTNFNFLILGFLE